MLDNSQVVALRGLAVGFREATEPGAWPIAAGAQLTLLSDVVMLLGGDEHQVEQVLGPEAAAFVALAADALP